MANKKKNTSKANKSKGKKSQSDKEAVTLMCAQSDPFCVHSEGAFHPSGADRSMLVPFTFRDLDTAATGATGEGFMFARGGSQSTNYRDIGSNPVGVFPATTAYNHDVGTFSTVFDQVRCVTAGIKWHCILPDDVPGGTLAVIPIPNDMDLLDGATHNLSSLLTLPGVVVTDVREPGAYIFPVVDSEQADEWYGTSGTAGPSLNGYGSVLLYFTGPATTIVLHTEYVARFEGTVNLDSGIVAGKSSPHIPWLQRFKNTRVGGYVSGKVEEVSHKLKEHAKEYARTALKQILAAGARKAIGYYMAGPAAPMIVN